MKRVFAGLMMLAVLAIAVASAWAGGDKVRGDKGKGAVNQVNDNAQGNQN